VFLGDAASEKFSGGSGVGHAGEIPGRIDLVNIFFKIFCAADFEPKRNSPVCR
jgi:hypothetical protein